MSHAVWGGDSREGRAPTASASLIPRRSRAGSFIITSGEYQTTSWALDQRVPSCFCFCGAMRRHAFCTLCSCHLSIFNLSGQASFSMRANKHYSNWVYCLYSSRDRNCLSREWPLEATVVQEGAHPKKRSTKEVSDLTGQELWKANLHERINFQGGGEKGLPAVPKKCPSYAVASHGSVAPKTTSSYRYPYRRSHLLPKWSAVWLTALAELQGWYLIQLMVGRLLPSWAQREMRTKVRLYFFWSMCFGSGYMNMLRAMLIYLRAACFEVVLCHSGVLICSLVS